MLKARLITAAILIPLMLSAIFLLDANYFQGVMLINIVFAGWEWARFSGIKKQGLRILFALLMGGVAFLFSVFSETNDKIMVLFVVALLFWIGIFIQLLLINQKAIAVQDTLSFKTMLLGLFLMPITFVAIVYLHTISAQVLFFSMFIIWVADSAAYFSGKKFGRQKLAKIISPGKTWQGIYGALLACCMVAIMGGVFFQMSIKNTLFFIVICLFTVSFSVVGDLLESYLKRRIGIKDSSQLLPGHGGVMDRIDSMVAALPIFSLGWLLLGHQIP